MTLDQVLNEYRAKHAPNHPIDAAEIREAVAFFEGAAQAPGTSVALQRRYVKATKLLIRCQRLLDVIEKYEPV